MPLLKPALGISRSTRKRRDRLAWGRGALLSGWDGMGWAASYSSDATLFCSALCRWLHLPALLRSAISVPTAPHSKETSHQLATEANPPLTVSPVRGASTGTMGLGFRQGVPQTPKVEQHLCPQSDRPTLCSDSRAPRATRSCLLPRTALR